ncbi:MAG: glycosyltransferase family 2 protein [Kiritimatiellae bacterium]|nr:glycosyltransferase family 2 protein [Kiritimatiellia bacterium]
MPAAPSIRPIASVVMPCYNVAPHLAAALESVRRQSRQDIEIVAVDDGSTDGTGDILRRFAAEEPRLRVLSQPNRGVSAARNAGIDAACGRYVFFVDPDDAAHPDMVAKGVAEMERSGADCCLFAYRRRFGDDGEWREMPLQGDYRYSSNAEILDGFFPHLFGYSNEQARIWCRRGEWRQGREEGSVCRGVYRLDLIRRAHVRFDETIVLYEDAMFNCEYLVEAQSMTCIGEPLYDYTVRPEGAVSANNRTRVLFTNKRRLLERRKEIDRRSGGRLAASYSASCVFSVFEMLHALVSTDVPILEGLREIRAYMRDPVVRSAFRSFPLGIRRPFASSVVLLARMFFR